MFEVCYRYYDNCKDMYICSLILVLFYVKMNVMEYIIIWKFMSMWLLILRNIGVFLVFMKFYKFYVMFVLLL